MCPPIEPARFIRYQSVVPNQRGVHPGIFALVNKLGAQGELSPAEHARWRAGNDWYNAAYPNPSLSRPQVYDRVLNPGAAAWFKHGATHLLARVEPYLLLLDAHGIDWERLETADPGRIIYEDPVQVIAAGGPRG
ncbi:hypothetical protein [Glutamicibacter sp. AOP33-2CA-4]|uniref:hypothetical protein n=1 Tax=Glutamicibacter sp. AOP33-2CA-4 TaxID=3457690 RepID=UPI0040341479